MLAGIMIALGGVVNLTVGGPLGAVLFSIGLITILVFGFDLFTGKAGLLATGEITPVKLAHIWGYNFMGAAIMALIIAIAKPELGEAAKAIVEIRNANGELINMFLGILCGILMYVAVMGYKKTGNFLLAVFPVAVFILCGYNHCVADMFYISLGATKVTDLMSLIPTTIGNVIGANLLCFQDAISLDG